MQTEKSSQSETFHQRERKKKRSTQQKALRDGCMLYAGFACPQVPVFVMFGAVPDGSMRDAIRIRKQAGLLIRRVQDANEFQGKSVILNEVMSPSSIITSSYVFFASFSMTTQNEPD
jgi:hypothetical protein